MFIVYGQRFYPYEPFILTAAIKGIGEAGDILDDGQPRQIILGRWEDKTVADQMAENIKNNTPKRSWKIWVEEST